MSEALVTPDGWVTLAGARTRAALGRAGVSPRKTEGDEATPSGLLPLRRVLFRADRVAAFGCAVPREPLAPEDGWCDDPDHAAYNTQVTLPFAARHEMLWQADAVYDVIGVLGWNDAPVERRRGSAIFLHVARPDYAPTEGCIALALPDLVALLGAGMTSLRIIAA
jgi:L,D-peptidoglycan transpeptidase YkuD (ErfK/YbiS/YcfS/YnhG family)